jgi:outer membrane protein assembly factor BamB
MKKSVIYIFVSLILVIILVIIIGDFRSTRPDRMSGNPFKLDIDRVEAVDPGLITYRETRNYRINARQAGGIAVADEKIYLVADTFLQVIDHDGRQVLKINLPEPSSCLVVNRGGDMVVGFRNSLALFDPTGEEKWRSEALDERAVITALALKEGIIFAADAGNRAVHRFTTGGRYEGSFNSKTSIEGNHGFIIPSPYFDLDVTPDGELWVVNPGKHALENYTDEGELRSYLENVSPEIDGFSGCCNPAHIAIMADGSFLTSEKGVVRIKIHKPSGELSTVVAPPDQFKEDGDAPDVAVDGDGIVYALDYDRNMIRIFEPK